MRATNFVILREHSGVLTAHSVKPRFQFGVHEMATERIAFLFKLTAQLGHPEGSETEVIRIVFEENAEKCFALVSAAHDGAGQRDWSSRGKSHYARSIINRIVPSEVTDA
jgi:hypothetical protein